MTTSILYTIPNLDTAGSGKALANLIEALDRTRFEPTVAVARTADTYVARRLADLEVPVRVMGTTIAARPLRSLRRRIRTAALACGDTPAIWHSFHYLDDYTEPLIAHAAGARWIYTKKNMSWNRRSWRLRTRFADAVVAQNTDMLADFFAGDRPGRVHHIPRGVPLPVPTAVPASTSAVRRKHGLPDRRSVVTCVARIQPRKRQTVLVEATSGLAGVHLALAGDGDDASIAAVDDAALQHGSTDRVHRLGQIQDVDDLVTASTVVCLPTAGSAAEGCPVALLEAMALGAAVVVTDIAGSRDVVRHEVDGLVVPPDDPEVLRAAIARLLDDDELRGRLGAAAAARIASDFSIALEARRHQALYDQVLARA